MYQNLSRQDEQSKIVGAAAYSTIEILYGLELPDDLECLV